VHANVLRRIEFSTDAVTDVIHHLPSSGVEAGQCDS
jgi:hypothetical protein